LSAVPLHFPFAPPPLSFPSLDRLSCNLALSAGCYNPCHPFTFSPLNTRSPFPSTLFFRTLYLVAIWAFCCDVEPVPLTRCFPCRFPASFVTPLPKDSVPSCLRPPAFPKTPPNAFSVADLFFWTPRMWALQFSSRKILIRLRQVFICTQCAFLLK